MSSVRLRRLQSDHERLLGYIKRQPRLRLIQAEGQPPERYQVEYHVRGLRQVDDQLRVVEKHLVEISLPRNYPRTPPLCRMLTPIFHPNIAPHAICIGDHWGAGEPLWAMVARIGEMIAYQSYNTKSPLNGEAARWVDENQERLPLDPVAMYVEEPEAAASVKAEQPIPVAKLIREPAEPSTARPGSSSGRPSPAGVGSQEPMETRAANASDKIVVQCPNCGARYAIDAHAAGRKARCGQCQARIPIPPRTHQP
jgi:predicted Zn finger-like uncharacterized protein